MHAATFAPPSPLCFALSPILVLLSFPADVESLSRCSSDEEEERAARKTALVTSMDEALRTVNDSQEPGEEDFLRQNFEALAESCSSGGTEQMLPS